MGLAHTVTGDRVNFTYVKITYLHTLLYFKLAARSVPYYHVCDSAIGTAASPVADWLHADPACTTNRNSCPNVA